MESLHHREIVAFKEERFRPFCVNPMLGWYVVIDTIDTKGKTVAGSPKALTWPQASKVAITLNLTGAPAPGLEPQGDFTR